MDMNTIDRIADTLRTTFGAAPDIVIVLGSGLGAFAEELEGAASAPATKPSQRHRSPATLTSRCPGSKSACTAAA